MSTLPGGFSPYTCTISDEAKLAFDQATNRIFGVRYLPVAVSQQVVSGMVYKFFCNTQTVTLRPLLGSAIVTIYAPLRANAYITHIQTL